MAAVCDPTPNWNDGMLIHLGDNTAMPIDDVIMLVNLETIDADTAAAVRQACGPEVRSAALVVRQGRPPKWYGSIVSSYTLWSRGSRGDLVAATHPVRTSTADQI